MEGIEKLWKNKHYQGIFHLLMRYQSYENGLRQSHFRYVLMKEHGLEYQPDILEIKRLFKNDMQKYNFFWEQFKGSIKTQKDLTYYIRYLFNKKKYIEKTNNKKPYRYCLTPKFYIETGKMKIKNQIDLWSDYWFFDRYFFHNTYGFKDIKSKDYPYNEIKNWEIFGLPVDLNKLFNQSEINEIRECIKIIEEKLWQIVELKNMKTKKLKKWEISNINYSLFEKEMMKTKKINFWFEGAK